MKKFSALSQAASHASSIHATTVLCVAHQGMTVMASDGQVTFGSTILKGRAKKVRVISKGQVLAGFAGSTADAFTLFELFEVKLEKFSCDLLRSSVELAKDWRMDRSLRRLEAMLIVADKKSQFILSGSGDVIEPDYGICAIGSGGPYAQAAALSLKNHSSLNAYEITKEAMKVAANICIYTNHELTIEKLEDL